jgi:predicted membrane protein
VKKKGNKMAKPILSEHKAHVISSSLFLLCLAALVISRMWWPGVLFAIGLPLAMRQYLVGNHIDSITTLVVFVGGAFIVKFDVPWDIIIPVILILTAFYILLREFITKKEITEVEKEEDLNIELEEDQKEK